MLLGISAMSVIPSPCEFIGARGGAFTVDANIRSDDAEKTFDFTNDFI